jgi:hypothetical protein
LYDENNIINNEERNIRESLPVGQTVNCFLSEIQYIFAMGSNSNVVAVSVFRAVAAML